MPKPFIQEWVRSPTQRRPNWTFHQEELNGSDLDRVIELMRRFQDFPLGAPAPRSSRRPNDWNP